MEMFQLLWNTFVQLAIQWVRNVSPFKWQHKLNNWKTCMWQHNGDVCVWFEIVHGQWFSKKWRWCCRNLSCLQTHHSYSNRTKVHTLGIEMKTTFWVIVLIDEPNISVWKSTIKMVRQKASLIFNIPECSRFQLWNQMRLEWERMNQVQMLWKFSNRENQRYQSMIQMYFGHIL